MTDAERVLVLVGAFFFEVEAHGFADYYGNPAGNHARDAVWALERVGATRAAAALRACNSLFPGGEPPADGVARWEAVKPLSESGAMDQIEAEYMPHHPEVWELLSQFKQSYAAELPGR